MDTNPVGIVRTGKPMLSQQQQQAPNRYPPNSYYNQSTPMSYPQQTQIPPTPHRSFSQNATPNYSTSLLSNGTINKPNIIDSIELKSDDSFDDLSKLQVSQSQHQQQQQLFHPLLQSRPRSQSPSYYPNMPPTNNTYYSSQRPLTPSSDYNMNVSRGIRPPNTYGTLPVQQRVFPPSSTNDLTIGLQSTPPPPPSVTPH